jgi:hypothetical protein
VPKNVSLAGTSLLTGDNSGGLSIYSRGAIKANNVTATDSPDGNGAGFYNVYLGALGGITLTGTNIFEDNAYDGFNAQSMGAISVNNLTGSRNGAAGGYGNGAVLDNVGTSAAMAVKLTGTNTFNDNFSEGLHVVSNGAISASNLTANRNLHGVGANLWNSHTNAGALTLTGSNTFQENRDSGLVIESQGAISLNSLTANGNGQLGLYGFGANIHNQTSATPQTVKLTGTNTFNDNYSGGLFVQSRGAISANNLTANHTTNGNGVRLFNNTGSAGVTLTGTNAFLSNGGDGLTIESTGAVSVTKVTADDNTAYGVYISNNSSPITITCGSMTSNGSWGLYADTSGLLKLIGVVASGNTSGNIYLSGSLRVDMRACSLP